MKAQHRGHTIEVRRERCVGGWPMLYTTIIRDADQYICLDLAEDSGEAVRDQVRSMMERVDAELDSDDPWCERGGLAWMWQEAGG